MGKIIRLMATGFGYILNYIYGIVNNYGLAIIIFTILLRLLMLPFSIKQQKTMKKTAKVQELGREIQTKYANDSVRQAQEMQALYKAENVSPFSGCLFTIIQMFIILAMFWLVSSPLTYMRHVDSEKIDKYVSEIQESGTQVRYREIAVIKAYRDKDPEININMNFLSLDLSDVPWENIKNPKVLIIPILYVCTSIISMKLTPGAPQKKKEEEKEKNVELTKNDVVKDGPITNLGENTEIEKVEETKTEIKDDKKEENKALVKKEEPKKDNDDLEAMDEMNKQMRLMMPVMSVSIALVAPLGLALYWLFSNLVIIGERVITNIFFKDKEEKSDGE